MSKMGRAPGSSDSSSPFLTVAQGTASYSTVVNHGGVAATARPAVAAPVMWVGSVAPTNATANDVWWDTTVELTKRWSGSAWKPHGAATYPAVGSGGLLVDVTFPPYNVVADGTTDYTTALNTAITDCNTAGGGTVLLPRGTVRASQLNLKSYVTLAGRGKGATTIKRPDADTTGNMLQSSSARQEQIEIRDLTLHGNNGGPGATSGYGIYLISDSATNGAFASGMTNPRHRVCDVIIRHCSGDGFHHAGDSSGGACEVVGVQTYHCDGVGFYMAAADSVFTDCDAGSSGQYGFYDVAGFNRYVGCKAWLSGRVTPTSGDGFRMGSSVKSAQLAGCNAQDNAQHGFNVFSTLGAVLTNCIADTNNSSGVGVGFNLVSADSCSLIGGYAFDRQGDSGTDPVKQLRAADVTSAVNYTVDIVAGLQSATQSHPVAGFDPTGVRGTLKVIYATNTAAFPNVNFIPHSEASQIDSNSPARSATTPRFHTMRRIEASSSITLTNGQVNLSYFTAPMDLTVGKITFFSRGTAAAGATLTRFGIYTYNSDGSVTLVARSASDTALFNSTFAAFEKPLDITGGFPATYAMRAGKRYGLAVITVGTTTAPAIYGFGAQATMTGWDPILAHFVGGQTDLPTSVAAGSLSVGGAIAYAATYA